MDSAEVSSSPNLSTDAPLMPLEEDKLQKQKEEAAANMVPRRSKSNGRKFLGVRQRPSGRWVAEIKDSSQKLRLWLGTFDRPEDAALAYDSAARLLRGKNAKTNFSCAPEFSKKNTHHEGVGCSFLGKNPRAYHLLQHAVMKNRAVYSSLCSTILPWKNQTMMRDQQDYDTLVEETVVCSSSSDEGGSGCSELSFGSSKVYSSVIVAPSFSSSLCQTRE